MEELWEESCLRRVSQCLGLSLEGFENEFQDLVSRVSKRRTKDKGKGVSTLASFDRELKRLEWTIKEKGRINSGLAKRGLRGSKLFMMHFNILSWNVRGVTNEEKREK